jgi:hypothetical protein
MLAADTKQPRGLTPKLLAVFVVDTRASSCGCRASSPVWRTGVEHAAGYYSPENRRAFVESSIGRSTSPRTRPALEG